MARIDWRRCRFISLLVFLTGWLGVSPAWAVRVAVVKSWSTQEPLPIFAELNNNWPDYGDVGLVIDLSLQRVNSFTYADLVATNADVIWLSNPAGGEKSYSDDEAEAVKQYIDAGHDLVGTYRVFRFGGTNNSKLAPLFGLPQVVYNGGTTISEQVFDLLQPNHPLFEGLTSPFVSTALARAQVPANGFEWQQDDLGFTTLLAKTEDNRGVILFHTTANYHAIYISHLVEFVDPPADSDDAQLIYNALTLGAAPTGQCCVRGSCSVVNEGECPGDWTPGGTCFTNTCPQVGACCFQNQSCLRVFEADCPTGMWIEREFCTTDTDDDGVIEPCDACAGFDDLLDADADGVADGCDRCPNFDDALDSDGDTAPNGCDKCPGADDRLDADGDGVPDACDICPGFDDDADCDEDDTPDGCDTEPDCNHNGRPDNCDLRDETSADCDENGVPDECQPDSDGDRLIDACDDCVGNDALLGQVCDSVIDDDDCRTGVFQCPAGVLQCSDGPSNDDVDSDGDRVYNCNDQCPNTPPNVQVFPNGCRPTGACCFNVGVCFDGVAPEDCTQINGDFLGHQTSCAGDNDADGVFGCADDCPFDPQKSAPGQCGCGRADSDRDGDATADCLDDCPLDPGKTAPGVCGCGVADVDTDGDLTLNCNDGCPTDADKITPGVCGCGEPDEDSDDDGKLDCEDGCPLNPDKIKPGVCGCTRPDVDSDGDTVLDCEDECPVDPAKTEPGLCGCGRSDVDSDGDLTVDCLDGCPQDANKTSPGVCGCNMLDVDADADTVFDCHDDCPGTPPQTTVDQDGCPLEGACCFNVGVCVNETSLASCALVDGVYQGNGTLCSQPCRFPGTGDFEGDGDVDRDDYANLADCISGPIAPYADFDCFPFETDGDDDIDLRDVRVFQNLFGGE